MKSEQTQDLDTLFAHGVKARSIASVCYNNHIILIFIKKNRSVPLLFIYIRNSRITLAD